MAILIKKAMKEGKQLIPVKVEYGGKVWDFQPQESGMKNFKFQADDRDVMRFFRRIKAKDEQSSPDSVRDITYKQMVDEIKSGRDNLVYVWKRYWPQDENTVRSLLMENKEKNMAKKIEEARSMGLKEGEYFKVDDIMVNGEEDNYEQGAGIGDSFSDFIKVNKQYSSFEDMVVGLSDYGISDDIDNWIIFEDGRFDVQQMENDDRMEVKARDSEYQQFKAGQINLWLVNYSIYVEIVSEGRTPSMEELQLITGLDTY